MFPIGLLLLFLCFSSSSSGYRFSRNSDGTFSAVQESSTGDDEVRSSGKALGDKFGRHAGEVAASEYDAELSMYSSQNGNVNKNHVVHSPLDDEDLDIVQEYFEDVNINKTGQLKYDTLAVVEKSLIKDIVRLILKDEEYMLLLNNPSFPKVVHMVKDMLREPIQEVLQQQIWSKVLAVQAYYQKYYKPLNNPQTKKDALEFLSHLKEASKEHKLTVGDTVKLKEKMQTLSFLIQEKTFNERLEELKRMLGKGDEGKRKKGGSIRKSVQGVITTTTTTPSVPTISRWTTKNYDASVVTDSQPIVTTTSPPKTTSWNPESTPGLTTKNNSDGVVTTRMTTGSMLTQAVTSRPTEHSTHGRTSLSTTENNSNHVVTTSPSTKSTIFYFTTKYHSNPVVTTGSSTHDGSMRTNAVTGSTNNNPVVTTGSSKRDGFMRAYAVTRNTNNNPVVTTGSSNASMSTGNVTRLITTRKTTSEEDGVITTKKATTAESKSTSKISRRTTKNSSSAFPIKAGELLSSFVYPR